MVSMFTSKIPPLTSLQCIILATIFLLFLFLYHKKRNELPLLGILPELLLNFHPFHDKATQVLEKSTGTFQIKSWLSQQEILFTCDPENVHYMMTTNISRYPKGNEWRKRFDILGDQGVFSSDFEEWKSQIKMTRAYLSHKKFHQLTEKIIPNVIEKGLIPILEHVSKQDVALDLQDLFTRYTFDFINIIATGFNANTLCIKFPEIPFSNAMNDAGEAIFFRHILPESLWKLQRWLGIGKERKYSDSLKVIDHFSAKHISIRREILGKEMKTIEDEESFNTLNLSLSGHEIAGPTLADEKVIKDNLLGIIFAGEEITRTALSWFFLLISKNPFAVIKIREELLRRNLPQNEVNKRRVLFRLDEISKLVYLHAALCETIRLFPPGHYQSRSPTEPDSLPSGHNVNKRRWY